MTTKKRKITPNSIFPVNETLCVVPTDKESQFESFQSIMSQLLYINIDNIYDEKKQAARGFIDLSVPKTRRLTLYETMLRDNGIQVFFGTTMKDLTDKFAAHVQSKPEFKAIGVKANPRGFHYIAFIKDSAGIQIKDPYMYYQAIGTEGFCQSFAYFLVTDNRTGFEPVNQKRKIDVDTFHKLAFNTQMCMTKLLGLLNGSYKILFCAEFAAFVKVPGNLAKYGIQCLQIRCDDFLRDCEIINSDINNVKYYIYEGPLHGWRFIGQNDTSEPRTWRYDLWVSFNVDNGPVVPGKQTRHSVVHTTNRTIVTRSLSRSRSQVNPDKKRKRSLSRTRSHSRRGTTIRNM